MSGLYYYPKDKGPRSPRDLQCLAAFTGHELYRGVSWKKKHRAPSDYCFALKPPRAPSSSKGGRGLKMLCVEDEKLFEKWLIAIRIAKVCLIDWKFLTKVVGRQRSIQLL